MLLEKTKTPIIRKDGSVSKKYSIAIKFMCDECGTVFIRTSDYKTKLHFCSNACKFKSWKSGGKLAKQVAESNIDKYGVSSPMKLKEVQNQRKRNFQDKYGEDVTSPLAVPGAKERRRKTHMERYGVEETFQSKEMLEKRVKTWMKNYGQNHPPIDKWLAAIELSMTNDPNKWSSRGEEKMCDDLAKVYGEVVRQKRINRWPIDAYIPSIDLYVQYDGEYWHGLDRPIEVIRESTSERDEAICAHWENDREQEKWCQENDINLMRITDKEYERSGIRKIVESHPPKTK